MKKLNKDQKIKELEFKIKVLAGSSVSSSLMDKQSVSRMTKDRYMASGLVITIQDLSGKELLSRCIQDGFSDELIKAINSEIEYSTELAIKYSGAR